MSLSDQIESARKAVENWPADVKAAMGLSATSSAEVASLRSEVETLRAVLIRKGYRESCDIPACNCGDTWGHGGFAETRLGELRDVLYVNGKTILQAAEELVAERDRYRRELEEERAKRVAVESLLGVAKCPNCDGSATIPVQVGPGEWEPEPCQWCFEKQRLTSSLPHPPGEKP